MPFAPRLPRCVACTFLIGAPPAFAQSAASHPMITMQDAFECFGQARALRTLAEAARDNVDVAAAAARQAPAPEQRREVAGIVRAGVRAQETALQLADALDACVTGLITASASWPTARAAMFRIEADAILVRADRFSERYAQVAKSLADVASDAAVLQKYGAFGEALKQKAGATREKMKALGRPAPAASAAPPGP